MKKINKKLLNKMGFSLIEVLVSMTIFLFLLMLSLPSYTVWLASTKVKNVAEGVNIGLLQARSEAIRRNDFVYFSLNEDTSWSIVIAETGEVINRKGANEGNDAIEIDIFPSSATTVTFDGFGFLVSNIDGSSLIETIDVSSTVKLGEVRTLRIIVDEGTNFICDPEIEDEEHFSYCKEY